MKYILVVLGALCLATIVLALPTKPNPPAEYSLSAYAITSSGNFSVRAYYDEVNQKYE